MYIPEDQRFTCQCCGLLCKRLFIPVSEEERKRIERLEGEGEEVLFLKKGENTYLARKEDGRCVFLDDENLCRLHKRFGEKAKPLACRVFPFTFSLKGGELAAGVRFACPAVAANVGRPLDSYRKNLLDLAREVRQQTHALQPEEVEAWEGLSEEGVVRLVEFLADGVSREELDLDKRLICLLRLFTVLEMAHPDEWGQPKIWEQLQTLRDAAFEEERERTPCPAEEWSRAERSRFFQLLSLYARRDEESGDSWEVRSRLERSFRSAGVMLGKGSLQGMGRDLPCSALSLLKESSFVAEGNAEEPVFRFLRVKLTTHQFFGSSHHDFSLKEGFLSLLMAYPVAGAFARLYAADRGKRRVEKEDAVRAVSAVDHGFSHMKGLGTHTAKRLVSALASEESYRRLVGLLGFFSTREPK